MKQAVLFILPTLSRGGQERVVSRMSKFFQNYFDQFLVLFYKDRIDYEFNGEIIKFNLPLPPNNFWKIFHKIFHLILRVYKTNQIKKKLRPTVSLSFGPEANIINILSNYFLKEKPKTILSVRVVESIHFKTHRSSFLRQYYFSMIKFAYRKADIIVPNSKDIEKDLIQNFKVSQNKIKVIYNPLDLEEIEKLAKESLGEYGNLFQKNKVIITIGRLTYQKNQSSLIKVFSELIQDFPDLHLVILGEGETRQNLEKLASELEIQDKAHFLGFQKNPFKFLKNSYLFVLPSLYEGFPNVLLEAMATGLPVIASNCPGGIKEILLSSEKKIENDVFLGDFGILVKTNNDQALEDGIRLLLENENLKKEYGQKSRIRAEDFADKKIIPKWLELLNEL